MEDTTGTPHFIRHGEQLQAVRDQLGRMMHEWIPIMGLDRWEIDIDWVPDSKPGDGDVGAEAEVRSKYHEATIKFYLPNWLDVAAARREYCVVHELCHVMVHKMRGAMDWDANDMIHEEQVVTELARAFLRAREASEAKEKEEKPCTD